MTTHESPSTVIPAPSHATAALSDATDAELIFRSASAFDRMTAQMRRAMGINAHERLAIALLWDCGPLTMSELGAGIPLSRAAVTTLVDRLEIMGYVVRGGDVNDRRRTVVSITESGARGIEPLTDQWRVQLRELRERIGEDGWSTIRSYLATMHEMSSRYADRLSDMDDESLKIYATTPDTATGEDA